jgi:hypothetical protein
MRVGNANRVAELSAQQTAALTAAIRSRTAESTADALNCQETKMSDNENDDQLLTPDDLERWLKIRKTTQASMRSRGQLPFVQLAPRTPRYDRRAIVRWLAERRVPARSPEHADMQSDPTFDMNGAAGRSR